MRLVSSSRVAVGAGLALAIALHACTSFESGNDDPPRDDGGVESSITDAPGDSANDMNDAGDAGDPVDAAEARGPLRVFVSSGLYVGSSFGTGAPLADVKCAEEAGGGKWRAFLRAGGKTAGMRMEGTLGPWVHPKTGNVVFIDAAALDAPGTLVTINWDVTGNALEGGSAENVDVWTGAYDQTCANWADPGASGGVGRYDGTNATWRENDVRGCSTPIAAHLYCLEL